MHKVLGKSPLSYFQDFRIELAVHLLKTSDQNIEEIAFRVGYADGVALRVLLRRLSRRKTPSRVRFLGSGEWGGKARHTGASVGDRAALESESGGETFVALMKPADLRNRDHRAAIRRLDGASIRAVFVERQMGPRAVIVIDVREQDAAQMPLVDHQYMIEALAANRADDALDVRILPR